MKLYLYILDIYSESPKGLYVEECEVKETPKMYKTVNGSFPDYYYSTVRKDEIGQIKDNYLFLTEPDFEYAKEKFKLRTERTIANKLKSIERLKAELKIINESEYKEYEKI